SSPTPSLPDALPSWVDELHGRIAPDSRFALLTPAGRTALARYFGGGGRVIVHIQRAADIVRLLRWSKRHGIKVALVGAAEGWKVDRKSTRLNSSHVK